MPEIVQCDNVLPQDPVTYLRTDPACTSLVFALDQLGSVTVFVSVWVSKSLDEFIGLINDMLRYFEGVRDPSSPNAEHYSVSQTGDRGSV